MAETNGTTPAVEMVNLTIDGKPVKVPKGTNLIEAAKSIGIDVPYYCYHPHLSIAGNCRMCQMSVKGAPKLDIGCNTQVKEGMVVETHLTNAAVKDAQAATLEFILINHPLDCTVCDQAGQCKLQDFHYDYNARSSRFLEEKEHKVKALPLGPTVMLDGERCIMCTRCIRFCDEITGTSELGMLNRGDRSVISINQGKQLDNPLSGTVVDLCPVGALTHKEWRFNTRIWFTKEKESICPGCSTGCNVKVASRDGQVVQVKARLNSAVNKEWLCDEGRYGFHRFLPEARNQTPKVGGKEVSWDVGLKAAAGLKGGEVGVFVDGTLTTEDYSVLKRFIDKNLPGATVVLGYRERTLNKVQAILVSPDYAANFQGAVFAGLVSGDLQRGYIDALTKLKSGGFSKVLVVGDRGIIPSDMDSEVKTALSKAALSVAVCTDSLTPPSVACSVVLPSRSILEKSGLLINRAQRIQYTDVVVDFPGQTEPEWRIFNRLSIACGGGKLVEAATDRDLTIWYLRNEPKLSGLTIGLIKNGGVCLAKYTPGSHPEVGMAAHS